MLDDPSKSLSRMFGIVRVWSLCRNTKLESRKQWVEPESTKAVNGGPGIESEVRRRFCMGILGYAAVFNLFSEYSTIHNLTTKTV